MAVVQDRQYGGVVQQPIEDRCSDHLIAKLFPLNPPRDGWSGSARCPADRSGNKPENMSFGVGSGRIRSRRMDLRDNPSAPNTGDALPWRRHVAGADGQQLQPSANGSDCRRWPQNHPMPATADGLDHTGADLNP